MRCTRGQACCRSLKTRLQQAAAGGQGQGRPAAAAGAAAGRSLAWCACLMWRQQEQPPWSAATPSATTAGGSTCGAAHAMHATHALHCKAITLAWPLPSSVLLLVLFRLPASRGPLPVSVCHLPAPAPALPACPARLQHQHHRRLEPAPQVHAPGVRGGLRGGPGEAAAQGQQAAAGKIRAGAARWVLLLAGHWRHRHGRWVGWQAARQRSLVEWQGPF
jgi:hypothetical protein